MQNIANIISIQSRNQGGSIPSTFAAFLASDLVASKGGPLTFTRSSTVTVPDYLTTLQTVQSGSPAYDGVRYVSNLLLNSEVPATQTVTLAVGTYTNWVTGAGTLTSAAGTATVSGTGAATGGTDKTLVVTVAGTVTFTYAATLTHIQLEYGALHSESVTTTTVPVTKAFPGASPGLGILSEPAATNLLLQSNNFGTTWANTSANTTAAQNTVGPDGVSNSAWTITDTGATVGGKYQSVSLTAGTAYTFSIYIKKTVGALSVFPTLQIFAGTNLAITTIDTTNGQVITQTAYTGISILPSSSKISNAGNFYRVSLTFTPAASEAHFITIYPSAKSAFTSTSENTPANTGSIIIYGCQLGASSFVTSYIPTTTTTSTRAATKLNEPIADLPAGTKHFRVDWTPTGNATGTDQVIAGSYVDTNNSTSITFTPPTSLIMRKRIGGSNTDATLTITAPTLNTTYTVEGWINADNSTKVSLLGTSATNSNTTAPQLCTTWEWGSLNGVSNVQGFLKNVKILGR